MQRRTKVSITNSHRDICCYGIIDLSTTASGKPTPNRSTRWSSCPRPSRPDGSRCCTCCYHPCTCCCHPCTCCCHPCVCCHPCTGLSLNQKLTGKSGTWGWDILAIMHSTLKPIIHARLQVQSEKLLHKSQPYFTN